MKFGKPPRPQAAVAPSLVLKLGLNSYHARPLLRHDDKDRFNSRLAVAPFILFGDGGVDFQGWRMYPRPVGRELWIGRVTIYSNLQKMCQDLRMSNR